MVRVTENRKAREKEAREELIVHEADLLLREHGYIGLNLDELAERVEYSKGTLYQHFSAKEDIVLAVVQKHVQKRADLFHRAADFEGRTREKICGIGMADSILSKLNPHAFALDQLVQTASVWEKTSERMRERVRAAACHVGEACQKVMKAAREAEDLPADSPPCEHIVTGLICLSKGAHLLAQGRILKFKEVDQKAMLVLRDNYHHFLDGVGWRPFFKDWDYEETERRLRNEVFAEEVAIIVSQ